jgi:hypothetical protein
MGIGPLGYIHHNYVEAYEQVATISGLATKGPNPVLRTIKTVYSYQVLQVYFWLDLSRKLDGFRDFSVLGLGCCLIAIGDIQSSDIFHDDVFRIYIHETVVAADAGTTDQGGYVQLML